MDLLLREGVPTNPLPVSPSNEPSPRKRGMRRGAAITFASIVMFVPFFAFALEVVDHPGPLVIPATLFLAGIFWMLYYKLFGDETAPAPRPAQAVHFGPPPQHAYLPPQQSAPAYRSPVETPREHSVVENTTRSLEQQ
jgi:hypothetical protein